MKFVAIASVFSAFAATSGVFAEQNLRTSNFLQAKPAEQGCIDGEYRCACRDGTVCNYTKECKE